MRERERNRSVQRAKAMDWLMAYLHRLAREHPNGAEIRAPRARSGDLLKRERTIANLEKIHDCAALAAEIGRLAQDVLIPVKWEDDGRVVRSGPTIIDNFLAAMPALKPINPKSGKKESRTSANGISSSQLQRDNYRRLLEPFIPVSHLAYAVMVAIGPERTSLSDWIGRAIIQPDWLEKALVIANDHEGFTLGMSPRIPAFSFHR